VRGPAALLSGVLLGFLLTGSVAAHSLLLESAPAANATVAPAPDRIMLRFNNRIEKRLCRVRLVDAAGAARTLEVRTADGRADELVAAVPALGPGGYKVEWQVFSTDGHVVSGAFPFRVGG
jgi:methionine-rich copper-binding protein CopC